jgi:chromatin segregation and condensation protein Rec8/ScpA/Scc1 (kleisin family)
MRSRQEIVCTFLAMLELIKLNRLSARQDNHFDEIVIEQVEGGEPDPVLQENEQS